MDVFSKDLSTPPVLLAVFFHLPWLPPLRPLGVFHVLVRPSLKAVVPGWDVMSSGNGDLCPVPSWKLEALPAWNGCGMSLVNHTLIQILLAIIPDRKPGSPHVQGSGSQANCLQVFLISSVCSSVTHKKRFAEQNSK